MKGVSDLQEGLLCKDGEHCAYAHDISALDIQLRSKIRKVHDYVALVLRAFSLAIAASMAQAQRLRSL